MCKVGMVAHGDKLGQGVWVRLVWWPMGTS